jgi:hypothetical protein
MTPLVRKRGVTVNAQHFYSSWCYMFDMFVDQLMLLMIYLANP